MVQGRGADSEKGVGRGQTLEDSVAQVRLSALLDLSHEAVILLNEHGVVTDFNDHAAKFFLNIDRGMVFESLLGQRIPELYDAKDTSLFHFLSAGTNKELSPISWKGKRVQDERGYLLGYYLIGVDLSHQEHLENELRTSLRLIQDQKMALDESSIVAITDHRGVIQYINETFCRISGYEAEELIGKTHSVVKSGHHSTEFFKDLWGTIASGKVWKGEIKNKTKQGGYYWVDTTIVPFLNDSGRPYQYVAIRTDITEKKELQKSLEIEQLRALHAEKMASLGELAAGIAHELGNPAASINAWLDVVESQYERGILDTEGFIKMIPKVRNEASRIRDIIRGMLAYARDGSHDPFLSENPFLLLSQVLENCSYKIKKSGIQVHVKAESQYLSIQCRGTEISQTLINIILNSCDAILDLEEKWIEVGLRDFGDEIEFRVTDSGSGIPKDVVDRIFNPFFTTKPVGKGTGLGLSIVKSIIEHHQGRIFVDSEAAHTSFVIRLPKRQEKLP